MTSETIAPVTATDGEYLAAAVRAARQAPRTGLARRADSPSVAWPWPCTMRAVQITRFGGPEVLDVVDLPDPVPGDGEQLYDISSSGVNFADTHHRLSCT